MTQTKEDYQIALAEMPQADIEASQWFLKHHDKIKSALRIAVDYKDRWDIKGDEITYTAPGVNVVMVEDKLTVFIPPFGADIVTIQGSETGIYALIKYTDGHTELKLIESYGDKK